MIFGVGCLDRLPEEIDRLGASRALVLSTPEQREQGGGSSRPVWVRERPAFSIAR